jgi:hypothetical protein
VLIVANENALARASTISIQNNTKKLQGFSNQIDNKLHNDDKEVSDTLKDSKKVDTSLFFKPGIHTSKEPTWC